MKRLIYLILIMFMAGLVSCEKDGELIKHGYFTLNTSFIYSPDANVADNYVFLFNGDTLLISSAFTRTGYIDRYNAMGTLEVVEKGQTEAEYSQELILTENTTLQFIKLPGQAIDIYTTDSYTQVSVTITLFPGYKTIFNGQELVNGFNYIRNNKLSGNLEFYGEDETAPVYTIEDMILKADQNIVILQSSSTEFISLEGGASDEEPPASERLSKVNFYYAPTEALNVDSIRLEMYSYDQDINEINPIGTIVIEKGKLSPYLELDIAQYQETYGTPAGFAYSLYNAETGDLIEDIWNGATMFSIEAQSDDQYKSKYKFATYQIGRPPKFIMGDEWQSDAEQ